MLLLRLHLCVGLSVLLLLQTAHVSGWLQLLLQRVPCCGKGLLPLLLALLLLLLLLLPLPLRWLRTGRQAVTTRRCVHGILGIGGRHHLQVVLMLQQQVLRVPKVAVPSLAAAAG